MIHDQHDYVLLPGQAGFGLLCAHERKWGEEKQEQQTTAAADVCTAVGEKDREKLSLSFP